MRIQASSTKTTQPPRAQCRIMPRLWSEGIGSEWGTGGVTTDAETYQLLAVNPEVQTIIGFLSVGYPASEGGATKPPRKLGVSDVLRDVP